MTVLTVGLTGGLACGKSTAAQQFATLGVLVIDADEVERTLLSQDASLVTPIIEHFGSECLNQYQQLDRAQLRRLIFEQPEARVWMENFIHPPVYLEIQKRLCQTRPDQYALVVLPVLFESPPPLKLDRILVITAPESQQIQRAQARAAQSNDTLDNSQISAILQSQLPNQEKAARADDTIINDRDLAALYQQVRILHQKYTNLISEGIQ